jgi:predicted DsbA family dithiol-disulfide isomerase
MAKAINIEIVSDPVCPWCFVGKRRLDKAIKLRPDLDITRHWQPFQLSPDMPREGVRRAEHYAKIFGPERAASIMGSMRETGREEGIEFGADPEAVSPNTLAAHVLMLWAQQDSAIDADALAEKLFHAHHVACENIGDTAVLARIAGEAGMDADSVAARLETREDEDTVRQLIQASAARGVSGVPFFIVNGRYGISGAQPPEVLAAAFDQIAAADDSA